MTRGPRMPWQEYVTYVMVVVFLLAAFAYVVFW